MRPLNVFLRLSNIFGEPRCFEGAKTWSFLRTVSWSFRCTLICGNTSKGALQHTGSSKITIDIPSFLSTAICFQQCFFCTWIFRGCCTVAISDFASLSYLTTLSSWMIWLKKKVVRRKIIINIFWFWFLRWCYLWVSKRASTIGWYSSARWPTSNSNYTTWLLSVPVHLWILPGPRSILNAGYLFMLQWRIFINMALAWGPYMSHPANLYLSCRFYVLHGIETTTNSLWASVSYFLASLIERAPLEYCKAIYRWCAVRNTLVSLTSEKIQAFSWALWAF